MQTNQPTNIPSNPPSVAAPDWARALVALWATQVEDYPDTPEGRHAKAAVNCCGRELLEAYDRHAPATQGWDEARELLEICVNHVTESKEHLINVQHFEEAVKFRELEKRIRQFLGRAKG